MDPDQIDRMLRALRPVLKNQRKARQILERCWRDQSAIVWCVDDVHRAANEKERALTNNEAREVLRELLRHHNPQYGIQWQDLTQMIDESVLGRKLTKAELNRFIEKDIITIQR